MGAWSAWEIPAVPSGLTSVVGTAKTISSTVTKVLGVVKDAASALAQLESPSSSIAQTAISQAVKTLESGLKSLLGDSGVYLLAVPVRKHVVVPPELTTALNAVGLTSLPPAQQSLDAVAAQAAVFSTTDPTFLAALSAALSTDGGNAGFLRTVVESLSDTGDQSRPQLGDNDTVSGFCVLAGNADYTAMTGFLGSMKSLVGSGKPSVTVDVPAMPVPQNVRAQVVTGSSLAVQLTWDAPMPYAALPVLDTNVAMSQVAIIRSQSPKLVTKHTVMEIFGSTDLSTGMTVGVGDEEIKVLSVFDSAGALLVSDYTDKDLGTEGIYYYSVAFNMKAGSSTDMLTGTSKAQGFNKLSNVVKVQAVSSTQAAATKSALGQPPDWIRTPSIVDVFPDLSEVIGKMSSLVGSLGSYTANFGDALTSYVTFLDSEIKNWEQLVENITGPLERISGVLSSLSSAGGLYIHKFQGTGGNTFLINDLTHALLDKTDSTRPPFDIGTEFVAGLIVIVVDPGQLDTLSSLLSGTPSAPNPITDAIAALQLSTATAESKVFADNLQAVSAVPAVAAVGVVPDGCPPATTPATVAFGNDFTTM